MILCFRNYKYYNPHVDVSREEHESKWIKKYVIIVNCGHLHHGKQSKSYFIKVKRTTKKPLQNLL